MAQRDNREEIANLRDATRSSIIRTCLQAENSTSRSAELVEEDLTMTRRR